MDEGIACVWLDVTDSVCTDVVSAAFVSNDVLSTGKGPLLDGGVNVDTPCLVLTVGVSSWFAVFGAGELLVV